MAQHNIKTATVINVGSRMRLRVRSMTLEGWKAFFEIGGVFLLGLTFVFGIGLLITGNRISALKDEQLREFNSKLTDAQTALGVQQERAAKAEKDLLAAIQERGKPRQISAAQRQKMIEVLTHSPKGPTTVRALFLDEEGRAFASQIGEVLRDSGWHFEAVGGYKPEGGPLLVGVVIMCRTVQPCPPHATSLVTAFSSAGMIPSVGQNPNIPEGAADIVVGIRP